MDIVMNKCIWQAVIPGQGPKRDRDIHNIWVKSMYSVILLTYYFVVYFDLPIPSDDVIIIILKFLVKLQHVFSTVFKNFSA